ncbi:MAG: hypothetical protein JRJ03_00225 [Deltaproteobacteria bacterium]|nr:hypothetical protein [Deltaproteobacteria bacterium]
MAIKNLLYIFILVLAFFQPTQLALADEVNYCTDPESWEEWEALVEKYPNDMEVQTLHALRLGLCVKVERGDLTVPQATDIFEKARGIIIQKRKAESGERDKLGL